jgi:hypothetical protein
MSLRRTRFPAATPESRMLEPRPRLAANRGALAPIGTPVPHLALVRPRPASPRQYGAEGKYRAANRFGRQHTFRACPGSETNEWFFQGWRCQSYRTPLRLTGGELGRRKCPRLRRQYTCRWLADWHRTTAVSRQRPTSGGSAKIRVPGCSVLLEVSPACGLRWMPHFRAGGTRPGSTGTDCTRPDETRRMRGDGWAQGWGGRAG